MLKLSKLKPVTVAVMDVLDPTTGDPTGATITFMSPEHPRAKEEALAYEREKRAAERARNRAGAGATAVDDPAVERDRLYARITFMTLEWEGFADDDGAPIAVSRARETYESYPWLFAQALRFTGDMRNFIPRSASSSSSSPAPTSA